MRKAFVESLHALAKKNRKIMLLTADLGYSVFEEFAKECPDQYLNMGVAEQHMTGFAAGLAMESKVPFIYSIVPFVTMRNFEQIRNDICYQNLNVKIVGVGAGYSYGPYGHTHHGLEDLGILRTLPNITLFTPGDPVETALVVQEAIKIKGPVYIRLGRAGEPILHTRKPHLIVGKGLKLRDGGDITLFAINTMVKTALDVAESLEKKNIHATVVSLPTLKPLDEKVIHYARDNTKAIFTLEEHSIIGGLGSVVAEILAESHSGIVFKRLGVPDVFAEGIGNQEHMRDLSGISPKKIERQILSTLKKSINTF